MIQELTTLYKERRDGKYQICSISVSQDSPNEPASIITEHGIEGAKIQTDTYLISEGKNIGKANETSIWDQAISEAESKWNKKIDEGYSVEKTPVLNQSFRPMLAHDWNKRGASLFKKLSLDEYLEFYIQPKLDGVRCNIYMTEYGLKAFSRKGKDISEPCSNILDSLTSLFSEDDDIVLDGEIYSYNPDYNIQDISGAVNRNEYNADIHSKLCLILFDSYRESEEMDFEARFKELDEYLIPDLVYKIDDPFVSKNVCTYIKTRSYDELMHRITQQHHIAVDNMGLEGIMIRLNSRPYEVNRRSTSLLKYKVMQDEEFTVVDITTPPSGREHGTAILVCETLEGRTFEAPLNGKREYRLEVYANKDKYIGEQATIQFQTYSKDNIPIFPKAIAIRNYE